MEISINLKKWKLELPNDLTTPLLDMTERNLSHHMKQTLVHP